MDQATTSIMFSALKIDWSFMQAEGA